MRFQLLGMLFGFVNVWVITRYFGAEAQGIIAVLFSFIAILLAFAQLGTTVSPDLFEDVKSINIDGVKNEK